MVPYLDRSWKRQGFSFCRTACKHFLFQQTDVGDPSQEYTISLNHSHQTNNVLVQADFLLKEIINYKVRSLRENLKPKPCRIDQVIARSIRQGRGLRFSCKDWAIKVNKLLIISLFALVLWACNWPIDIKEE